MTSRRRFTEHFSANANATGLRPGHPAAVEGKTIFPSTVVDVKDSPRLLVSGINQRKLGEKVEKGRWRAMPIFALTLEERATCPSTCHHWLDCYGNTSHMSRRHRHGPDLERKLIVELAQAQFDYPDGFVVRLHVLGDFYSLEYVELWRVMLRLCPALRIFGYTAHGVDTLMGKLIDTLNGDFGDRAYLRFSRKWPSHRVISAITIPDSDHPTDAIICPAQLDQTDCCGTCGLCWTTDKTIAFLQHGGLAGGRKAA